MELEEDRLFIAMIVLAALATMTPTVVPDLPIVWPLPR
jgi:hypothetical protein